MDVRLERRGFVSERLSHAVSPQAAAFISILGSQICHLPRWHIRSLQFATALCVCLSVEAEIMKFSPVRLMHHCYCDTAVSTSCRGRGWQNGLQSPPSNCNQLHTDYLHTVSFFSLYAPPPLAAVITFCSQSFLPLKTCWQAAAAAAAGGSASDYIWVSNGWFWLHFREHFAGVLLMAGNRIWIEVFCSRWGSGG